MYERADIIFVIAGPVVCVAFYVLQVLYHMAENAHIMVRMFLLVRNMLVAGTWQKETEQLQCGKQQENQGLLSHQPGLLSESQMRLGTRRPCKYSLVF